MPDTTIHFGTINGLESVLIHLPHFRTHSVRLTINAGSAHEDQQAYGAAHFLEHTAFQGTKELPSEQAVYEYAEDRGITRNASTTRLSTTYTTDAFELESAGFLASQLAFEPLLHAEALDKERQPIIQEARGRLSDPYYRAAVEHSRAYRGDRYARPVIGDLQDIRDLTLQPLQAFHKRNYAPANTSLIICSAEPLETQQNYVEQLTRRYTTKNDHAAAKASFDSFNPKNLSYSLQRIDAGDDAQTRISIGYGLPETTTAMEQIAQNVVGMILSKSAYSRLRRELALCYGADAGTTWLADMNYGRHKKWSHLMANARLDADDVSAALDALYYDVLKKPLSKAAFDTIIIALKRDHDIQSESTPAYIANRILPSLSLEKRTDYTLDEVIRFANRTTLADLQAVQQQMLTTKPIVLATSPHQTALDNARAWAEKHNP